MILGYSRLNFCEWRWKASGQNRRFASHELEGVRPLQQWHLPASCINGKQYPNNTCLKPKHLKQSDPCKLNMTSFSTPGKAEDKIPGVICYHPWSLKCNEWTSCQTNIHLGATICHIVPFECLDVPLMS